jgi:TRAP-type mannitol/chloroaromatic compound transport system permease large subunit
MIGLVLGMFIVPVGVMSIIIPLFMPTLGALGFDAVWFAVILLLNVEMGTTSPPFGTNLFVMKGVAPPGTTMGDTYKAALPFLGCDLIVMILLIALPQLVLWLPSIMR